MELSLILKHCKYIIFLGMTGLTTVSLAGDNYDSLSLQKSQNTTEANQSKDSACKPCLVINDNDYVKIEKIHPKYLKNITDKHIHIINGIEYIRAGLFVAPEEGIAWKPYVIPPESSDTTSNSDDSGDE